MGHFNWGQDRPSNGCLWSVSAHWGKSGKVSYLKAFICKPGKISKLWNHFRKRGKNPNRFRTILYSVYSDNRISYFFNQSSRFMIFHFVIKLITEKTGCRMSGKTDNSPEKLWVREVYRHRLSMVQAAYLSYYSVSRTHLIFVASGNVWCLCRNKMDKRMLWKYKQQ